MDNEVPCRDTDPVNMNLVNRTAETMAFTVDFGQQDINQEEKVKKFERFAQRSSLRRVNSPRQKETEKVCEENKTNNNNNGEGMKKSPAFTKSSPVTKERRSTVVLERSPGGRSVSHSRLGARGAATARKSSGNEDALSHTGTYTMDSEEHDNKKVMISELSLILYIYFACVLGFAECELSGQGPLCGGLDVQDIPVPGLGELHGGGQEEAALSPQQG